MSKVFIPQFSYSEEPSKEFVSQGPSPGQERQGIFPLEWPHLQSREGDLKWNQAMQEKEEKILKQAREKGLRLEKEAYENGFAQGEKDGLELGQKKFETLLDSFRQILEEMSRLHRDLYREHEREIVQIIFSISRKILHHHLPLPEAVIQETLRTAFRYVMDPRKIVVHLNPRDHQYLRSHPDVPPWAKAEGTDGTKIVPDPSITRGGCFLETSFGDIDATLESQLDQILSRVASAVDLPGSLPGRSSP